MTEQGKTIDITFLQIGDGNIDHEYWGRPEEMSMPRPVFTISADAPGSDLAAETAAALAAMSIVFNDLGEDVYGDQTLMHARELFEFADLYRGRYIEQMPTDEFYK